GDDASILSGSLTREVGEAVGIYTIGLGSLSAGVNYTIDYTGADFTIGTKVLSVTADTDQSKIYGETDPEFTYTATGFENEDDASILSGSLTREVGEAVGIYSIGLGSLSAGANYTIDYTGADFAINAKVLMVTADPGQSKIYGDADQIFTYTATGFENGDDASILNGSLTREPGEAVGIYSIDLGSLSAGANYTIDFTGADFAINAKVLMVTADPGQNRVYGDADPIFTYTATGFENGDDASILNGSLTREPGEAVGLYAIQQGMLNAGTDYTIDFSSADFEITPAIITGVAFEDVNEIYDGTAKSIEVSGLPDGASVNYANNEKTNAGTYEVTATVRQENYNDLVLTAELTIEKAAAVIAADAVQAFTYNNEVKNVVASLNHTETGLTYMPQQGYADAGTYVIEISSEETANYLSASREVTLVIENTEIDGVTLEGASYVYDGTSKSLKVSGLPDGAAVSYANNGQINAGSYTVTATIRLDNYDDKVLTAQLDIEKAEQEINFNEIEDRNQQTDEHFQLEAISSSGLPVIYSYTYETENPAATVGPRGLVRILGGGEVWITATQEGNRNYEAATPVVRTLTIVGGTARLNSVIINGTPYSNPGEEIYYLIDCGNAENEVHIELEQNEGSSIDQGDSFTMSTPGAGIYRETVTVTSEDGNTTKTYNITVEKNFNFEDIVIQKFNNVMLINNNPETNGGYKFVSYRWYKDGSVIGNEQYFSAGKNADDLLDAESSYYVVLETAEGEILKTCTSEIQLRSSFNISLAPNPVSSGGTMELLADFPKDELETMQLSIHNLNGTLIKHLKSNRKITSITLPYTLQMGVYVLKIRTENFNKSVKFIIK
ncbi:MBG domain-containing protein, partial [Salegentibacter salinarum]